MSTITKAYSTRTGKTYETWDELIAAEAEGHVVVAIITSGKKQWPAVFGVFKDRRDAVNKRARLRREWKQNGDLTATAKFHIRVLWKED